MHAAGPRSGLVGIWVSEILGDPGSVSRSGKGKDRMREMREETKAEEQQIVQERAHSDARLESVAVLKRPHAGTAPFTPSRGAGAPGDRA